MNPIRMLVDTDIGTDVDDLQALLVLFGAPQVAVEGICVSYGDTALRARIARRLCIMAGRPDVPVIRGCSMTDSDGPLFWMGHEGQGIPGLHEPGLDAAVAPPISDGSPDWERLSGGHLLAIAPLTSVARLVGRAAGSTVEAITIMGGDFAGALPGQAEHNFACDPRAASVVAASAIPATYCGFDQTSRARAGSGVADALEKAGALGVTAADQMRRWWRATAPESEMFPHDAVAALTTCHPEFFEFEHGFVSVEAAGPTAGRSVFDPDPTSATRRVTDMDVPRVEAAVADYMIAACERAATFPTAPERRT